MACRLSEVILVTAGLRAAQLIQQLLGKLLPKLAHSWKFRDEKNDMFGTSLLSIFHVLVGLWLGSSVVSFCPKKRNLNQSGDMMMILTRHPTWSPGKDLISQWLQASTRGHRRQPQNALPNLGIVYSTNLCRKLRMVLGWRMLLEGLQYSNADIARTPWTEEGRMERCNTTQVSTALGGYRSTFESHCVVLDPCLDP